MNISTLRRIIHDCRGRKKEFPRLRDWLLRLYDRVLNRWPKFPLPFRKWVCEIHVLGSEKPLFFRLGSSDFLVYRELYLGDEYNILLQYDLGNPRLIVDLGSNIGLSLRYWRQHYPQARILAVEPDGDNARLIKKNVPETGGEQVVLEQACVLGYARPVRLQQKGQGEWAYSVEDVPRDSSDLSGGIAAYTMPELLNRNGMNGPIDLLKCDIEGTEAELFKNCGAWLKNVRFGFVELHGTYRREHFERDTRDSGVPIAVLWTEERSDFALILFRTETLPPGPASDWPSCRFRAGDGMISLKGEGIAVEWAAR